MANMMKLRGVMAERGITQRRLAKATGMSASNLSTKITGKNPFNVDEANKICEELGITDPALKCQIFLQ